MVSLTRAKSAETTCKADSTTECTKARAWTKTSEDFIKADKTAIDNFFTNAYADLDEATTTTRLSETKKTNGTVATKILKGFEA
jgi:hypothetical protein